MIVRFTRALSLVTIVALLCLAPVAALAQTPADAAGGFTAKQVPVEHDTRAELRHGDRKSVV